MTKQATITTVEPSPPTETLKKFRVVRPVPTSGLGMGRNTEARVIALPDGFMPPFGAEAVADDKPVHDWQPVETEGSAS